MGEDDEEEDSRTIQEKCIAFFMEQDQGALPSSILKQSVRTKKSREGPKLTLKPSQLTLLPEMQTLYLHHRRLFTNTHYQPTHTQCPIKAILSTIETGANSHKTQNQS